MNDQKIREILATFARQLLRRLDEPECDVRTAVAQAQQTLGLMLAEFQALRMPDQAEALAPA